MNLFLEVFLAFLSTIGFSVLFNSPKKEVFFAGVTGGLAWGSYIVMTKFFQSTIAGSFFGALTVGLLGEFLARLRKKPATLYITAGIVPLVPGAGMYYTMLAVIDNDFIRAANKGAETFFIAAAIAVGVIISSAFSRSINRVKLKE